MESDGLESIVARLDRRVHLEAGLGRFFLSILVGEGLVDQGPEELGFAGLDRSKDDNFDWLQILVFGVDFLDFRCMLTLELCCFLFDDPSSHLACQTFYCFL